MSATDNPEASDSGKDDKHKIYKRGDPIPRTWLAWFDADKRHTAPWRAEARQAFRFAASKHWDDEDKQKLEAEMRPAITFDRSSVIIDAISGQEIQNRQQVNFLPREQGDALPNEMLTEAGRWFDEQADAPDEDTEAFVDSLWCGMGWTETRLNMLEDEQGEPEVERIDPIEMYWDASAKKAGIEDARRKWRLKSFTTEEAKEKWPDVPLDNLRGSVWVDRLGLGDVDPNVNDPLSRYDDFDKEDEKGGYDDQSINSKTQRFTIAQLQYFCLEPYMLVADPFSGQTRKLSKDEYKMLQRNLAAVGYNHPLEAVELRKKVWYTAFLGKTVIAHYVSPCPDHCTWTAITGKRDRTRNFWYGLYRQLRDPQLWANKWLSQMLHIMNANAKGGLLYEKGVFVDQAQAEQNWASPSGMIELSAGALSGGAPRVQERTPPPLPAALQYLSEFAINAIRDVVGVNLELLGMREANQAGVLEYQRRQAGLTILAPLFNSLRRYRRNRGRVMLYFIQNYLSDGRLVRIVGKEGAKYVPLMKQADVKYDIVVDDAPYSPNQKEIVWQSLTSIMPGIKDMIPPEVLLQLMDYSPLPASVVQKIKDVVTADTPEKQQAKQLQARAAIAEVAVNESKARLQQAQAMKAQAEAQQQASEMEEQTIDMPTPAEQELTLAQTDSERAKAADTIASARLKLAQAGKVGAEMQSLRATTVAGVRKTLVDTGHVRAQTEQVAAQTAAIPAELAIKKKQASRPAAKPSGGGK